MSINRFSTRQPDLFSGPKVYPSSSPDPAQAQARATRPALPAERQEKPAPGPRQQSQPVVTWTLIAVNVLVWVAAFFLARRAGYDVLLALGAKDNELIAQGQLWRLVTPIFLHVGLLHLVFNVYAIYVFGPQIERSYGKLRYLCIYVLSGIYGVLLSFVLSPHPAAGASGAIFGLIGTEAVFFYRYRNAFGPFGKQRLYSLLFFIGLSLAYTFTVPSIDIWGHVGGLLAGAALGWWMMPRYAVAMTERGLTVVDHSGPKQWGLVVLGAAILLALSVWVAIAAA